MSIKKTLMMAALAAVFGAAAWAADETPAPTAHEHAGKSCCRKATTKAADGATAGEAAEAAKAKCHESQSGSAASGSHCHKQADGSMKHGGDSGCCCCCPMAKEKDAASAPAAETAKTADKQ